MDGCKQTFDLGEPWGGLSEVACTMSAEEFKKYAMENFEWKELNEVHKELDPDPEFDAAFTLKKEEVDPNIAAIEEKINRLILQQFELEPNTTL